MGVALRVRVIWDDTIVEDRVFSRFTELRIGAGGLAQVAVPGVAHRYLTILADGNVLELRADAGVVDWIEFPGEAQLSSQEPLLRRLQPPFGSARISFGGGAAVVELERVTLPVNPLDVVLWSVGGVAAMLALLGGTGYQLAHLKIRDLGDEKPRSLSHDEAGHMRVRIGPDGEGSSRPQVGAGLALRGDRQAPAIAPTETEAPKVAVKKPKSPRRGRKAATPAPTLIGASEGTTVAGTDAGVTNQVLAREPKAVRQQRIENAQKALLQADLRGAKDGFTKAAKDAPLDYDQLNWMGLAYYIGGELDDAERTWSDARGRDQNRADAINNLAGVQKRRGNLVEEKALLEAALKLKPDDCHASNSLALLYGKLGQMADADKTLGESDGFCGGKYAYTSIQQAGLHALSGKLDQAFASLEEGLKRVDTMLPIKEHEVLSDLRLDPAFATLRDDARFTKLVKTYLPRAAAEQL